MEPSECVCDLFEPRFNTSTGIIGANTCFVSHLIPISLDIPSLNFFCSSAIVLQQMSKQKSYNKLILECINQMTTQKQTLAQNLRCLHMKNNKIVFYFNYNFKKVFARKMTSTYIEQYSINLKILTIKQQSIFQNNTISYILTVYCANNKCSPTGFFNVTAHLL